MSVLSTNCRGLGGAAAVRELLELANEHAPTVMCVLETQLHKSRVENIAETSGFERSFAVSSTCRSGGLGIFWNNSINIEILPHSQYHIDAVVSSATMEP
jgi:exonuclease III